LSPAPLLKVQEVSYSNKTTPLFSQISFSLEAAQMVAVIGSNGTGKTSLLQLMAGLRRCSTGNIYLKGRDLETYSHKELARILACAPQGQNFKINMTVSQLMRVSRYAHSQLFRTLTRSDKQIIDRALELTNTEQFLGRNISELSAGESQRVILAACLAQSPEILILDEPSSFMDPLQAQLMFALLQRVRQELNLAILISSHDIASVLNSADITLVLRQGELVPFTDILHQCLGGHIAGNKSVRISKFSWLDTAPATRSMILRSIYGSGIDSDSLAA